MFIEGTETISYQWERLKYFLDGDTGFFLSFPKEKQFFIPKHIFIEQKQLDFFRDLLSKYGKQIGRQR